eukprot:s317_g15.t1
MTKLPNPPLDCISRVRFAPAEGNCQFLAASWDGTVRLYDAGTQRLLGQHKQPLPVLDAAFFEDSLKCVAAGLSKKIVLSDFCSHRDTCIGEHREAVKCLEYDSEHRQILSASWDKTLCAWDSRLKPDPARRRFETAGVRAYQWMSFRLVLAILVGFHHTARLETGCGARLASPWAKSQDEGEDPSSSSGLGLDIRPWEESAGCAPIVASPPLSDGDHSGLAVSDLPANGNAAWSQQEPWNWQDNRGLSPRRRPKSPRKRGPAGKAGGKGEGAKGPPSATGVGDTTAAPRELPAAPVPAIPPPPREVASSSTTAASEQLLQQIMGALSRSREELPPQLRALLDEHTGEDHKSAGKVMHRLVSAQTTARRELDQVRAARRDFLAQWTKYTTKLCHTWQQQMTEKTRAMQEFDDTEEKWSQQLQGTSRELSKLNGEVQQVDGSDSEDMDAVDTVIEEELQKDDQRRQFQEQMAAREAEITKTLLAACQAAKEQEAYLQERPDRERSPRRRTEQAKPPTRTAAKTKTEPPEKPAGDKLGCGSQQQPPPT